MIPPPTPLQRFLRFLRISLLLYLLYQLFLALNLNMDSKEQSSSQQALLQQLLGLSEDVQMQKNVKTRFTDVIGIDEFKEELVEIVDYLKDP
jgi:ATP-dependent Zn protease